MKDCITDTFRRAVLEQIIDSRPMLALYTRQAQFDATQEYYTSDYETKGTGYQAGGVRLEGGEVVETPQGYALVFHGPVWMNATITARGAMIYLAEDSGRAIRLLDFGRDVSSTNDRFSVKLPAAAEGGVIGL